MITYIFYPGYVVPLAVCVIIDVVLRYNIKIDLKTKSTCVIISLYNHGLLYILLLSLLDIYKQTFHCHCYSYCVLSRIRSLPSHDVYTYGIIITYENYAVVIIVVLLLYVRVLRLDDFVRYTFIHSYSISSHHIYIGKLFILIQQSFYLLISFFPQSCCCAFHPFIHPSLYQYSDTMLLDTLS
jgi:hypothetical protein